MDKVDEDNFVTLNNRNYYLKDVDWLKNKCGNFEMLIDQKDEESLVLMSILMEILDLNKEKIIKSQSSIRIHFDLYALRYIIFLIFHFQENKKLF